MHSNRTRLIVIAVVVIAFVTGVVGSTLSAGDQPAAHQMPDGSTMQGGSMP